MLVLPDNCVLLLYGHFLFTIVSRHWKWEPFVHMFTSSHFLTFFFVCLLVPFALFCKSLYGCMCYFSRVLVKVLLWVSMGGPIILNLFTVLYPSCLRLLNLLFIVHLYLNCIGFIIVSIICVHKRPTSNIHLCIVDYFSLCHLCVQTILQTFLL